MAPPDMVVACGRHSMLSPRLSPWSSPMAWCCSTAVTAGGRCSWALPRFSR